MVIEAMHKKTYTSPINKIWILHVGMRIVLLIPGKCKKAFQKPNVSMNSSSQ